MAATVEQLSIIRAALDPSGYQSGARAIERANAEIATSQKLVDQAATTTTRAMENTERAFVKTARAVDPLAKELLAFQRAQETANRAVTMGVATQEQAGAVILQYRAKVDAAVAAKQRLSGAAAQTTNALGVTKQQMQQLVPQINDVATSLLGGASAFQVLTQQGGQITQAMGGVGNTFRALAGLFTPARVAVAGFTLAIGASVAVYESSERRLATLRRELRGTASDYAAFAQELERNARGLSATLPGATLSDTRMVQGRLAGMLPSDMRGDIEGLTRLVVDLAHSLDGDLTGALDRVTRAYRDPEQAARDLAERGVRGFNEEFRRQIELLVQGGQSHEAFRQIMERLRGTFGDAQRDVSDLERAWQNVRKGWETFTGSIVTRLEVIGGPLIRALGDAATGADRAGAMFATMGRMVQGAINPIGTMVDMLSGPLLRALQDVARIGGTAFGWLDRITNSPLLGFANPFGALSRTSTLTERPPEGSTPGGGSAGAADARVRSYITEAATRFGVDPAALSTLYGIENRPRADGTWPTSGAGAAGPFQLMPGTFADMSRQHGLGGDINDERSNVFAGAAYYRQMMERYGTPSVAAAAYNAGPGRIDGWLAGGALPAETRAYMATFGTRYQGAGITGPVAGAAPATASAPSSASSGVATGTAQAREDDRVLREARGGRADQEAEIVARITTLEETRNRITARAATENRELTDAETASVASLNDQIERQIARRNGLENATERGIRTGRDNLRVLQTEDDLRREIAQRTSAAAEAARADGRTLSPSEQREIEQQVRAEAAASREDLIRQNGRLIQSERDVAQAYLLGARSGMEAAARQQAIADARRTTVTGTEEWRREVERLTAQYLQLGLARAESQLGQQLVQQEQSLALLRAENDAVGSNTRERTMNLAVRRETARLEGIHPDLPNTEAGRRSISNTRAITEEQLRGQRLNAMESYGREAGSVLGKHISEAIKTGSTKGFKEIPGLLWDIMARGIITRPLEEWFGNMARNLFNGGGSGGGGGILGSVGSFFGLGGGGGGGFDKAASSVSWDSLASVAHTGGTIGQTGAWRAVNAAAFAHAPRYHSGSGPGAWIAPNEIRAVLTRDEVVLNRRQQERAAAAMRGGGRGVTIVQNISTPDVAAFRASQAQQAARARRVFARTARSA